MIRDIGRYNVKCPKGRCLLSFLNGFVGYVNRHPLVGVRGWDPDTLPPRLLRLCEEYSGNHLGWEAAEIVRQMIARGYWVDCIDARSGDLIKHAGKYDVIIDDWNNLGLWKEQNPNARCLFYSTGSHWSWHNLAEATRLRWLFQRRGVDVPAARQLPPQLNGEYADLISAKGNSFVRNTFGAYVHKMRPLCTIARNEGSPSTPKRWQKARSNFLWLGGLGWVLKGLDLAIEAFLNEPGLQLHIVGGFVEGDRRFERIYGAAVKNARNITVHPWLDVMGSEFIGLCGQCAAIIYPSASEGCSGAVVQCLFQGLLPLVTINSGLEIHGVWPPLTGDKDWELIDAIRMRCREISQMGDAQLQELGRYFISFAKTNHSRVTYSDKLQHILDELLGYCHRSEMGPSAGRTPH